MLAGIACLRESTDREISSPIGGRGWSHVGPARIQVKAFGASSTSSREKLNDKNTLPREEAVGGVLVIERSYLGISVIMLALKRRTRVLHHVPVSAESADCEPRCSIGQGRRSHKSKSRQWPTVLSNAGERRSTIIPHRKGYWSFK